MRFIKFKPLGVGEFSSGSRRGWSCLPGAIRCANDRRPSPRVRACPAIPNVCSLWRATPFHLKGLAIVLDGQAHGARKFLDADVHPAGVRMAGDIGQRFLGDAIEDRALDVVQLFHRPEATVGNERECGFVRKLFTNECSAGISRGRPTPPGAIPGRTDGRYSTDFSTIRWALAIFFLTPFVLCEASIFKVASRTLIAVKSGRFHRAIRD